MYAETLRSQTSNDAPHNGNNSNHNKSEKTNTITPEHRDTNMTNVHHKNDDDHAQKTDKTLAENSSNSSGTNSNRNSGTHNEQIESGDSPSNEVVVHNNVKPVVNNSVPVVSVSNANDVRQFDCGENNLFCFLTLNKYQQNKKSKSHKRIHSFSDLTSLSTETQDESPLSTDDEQKVLSQSSNGVHLAVRKGPFYRKLIAFLLEIHNLYHLLLFSHEWECC